VEVSSPEVYESVSEKCAQKKYGVWKTQGGLVTTPLGSSRVNRKSFAITAISRITYRISQAEDRRPFGAFQRWLRQTHECTPHGTGRSQSEPDNGRAMRAGFCPIRIQRLERLPAIIPLLPRCRRRWITVVTRRSSPIYASSGLTGCNHSAGSEVSRSYLVGLYATLQRFVLVKDLKLICFANLILTLYLNLTLCIFTLTVAWR